MYGHTARNVRAHRARRQARGGSAAPGDHARAAAALASRETPARRTATETGRQAFTLIELLVVIGIIALLVSIMMPSVNYALELARRAKCATNLNAVGKALVLYERTEGSFPYVPLHGGSWAAEIGAARDDDPFDGEDATDRATTSALYLLVREGRCSASAFVCPSTDEKSQKVSGGWDFVDGTHVSYGLMNPYGEAKRFDAVEGGVVLLADAGPYFDPATGLRNDADVVDLSGDPSAETVEAANSPTHRGDGQNAMVYGGTVRFEKRPDCGVDRDNIYTRSNDADGGDPGGSIPAPGGDASQADQGPASDVDSYIVP